MSETPDLSPIPVSGLIDPAHRDHLREMVGAVTRPWWSGEVVSPNGLIYGLNTAGTRPPLIWCFQGYGEFAALAAALGPDQPLYGMRSGHLVVKPDTRNHLHLALLCAEEILSLGLGGPLMLGGNCQGALLAQKMAQILTAADRAVGLLICLNPILFAPYAGRAAFIVGRYDKTNPLQRFHDAEAVLRANLPHGTIDTLPSEHGKLFTGRLLDLLADLLRRRMDEAAGAFPGTFPIWSLRADLTVPDALEMAAGSLCDVPVSLRNTSDVVWTATGPSGLSVANHWRRADGSLVQWLDGQQPLAQPLAPGRVLNTHLMVRAPRAEGSYLLEIDLQHAGVMWLSEIGMPVATCRVRVLSAGQGER